MLLTVDRNTNRTGVRFPSAPLTVSGVVRTHGVDKTRIGVKRSTQSTDTAEKKAQILPNQFTLMGLYRHSTGVEYGNKRHSG